MRTSRLLVCASVALGCNEALAIDWTRTWTNPARVRLPACETRGAINDEITRPELVRRYSGLADNIDRVTDMIVSAGWKRRGRGEGEVLYIHLPYRFVCTAELTFSVRERNARGMVTGTARTAGDCDLNVDSQAAKYLDPDKIERLKRLNHDFVEQRRREMDNVRHWDGLLHEWRPGELLQAKRQTDGVFTRTLRYDFCQTPQQHHGAEFNAAWRGAVPTPGKSK